MEQPDRRLCDKCHERPAVSNICYGRGSNEGRSLCEICLKQDLEVGGLMQRMDGAIRGGNCKYCGAPAETMWGGSSSVLGDNFNLVCMTCFNDLTEFVRRPENAIDFVAPGDEAALRRKLTKLADLMKRKEEVIRQQVRKRKSKG